MREGWGGGVRRGGDWAREAGNLYGISLGSAHGLSAQQAVSENGHHQDLGLTAANNNIYPHTAEATKSIPSL